MTSDVLLVLDLDGTLVYRDGTHEDFKFINQLRNSGVRICMATRNDRYVAESRIDILGVRDQFDYVMSDFRPKSIQVRHILYNYRLEGVTFDRVIFVDDYEPNTLRMKRDMPDVETLRFGHDIRSLHELLGIIESTQSQDI